MGRVVAQDLVESEEFEVVVAADANAQSLRACRSRVQSPKLDTVRVDASDESAVADLMKGFDVSAVCLPNRLSLGAVRAAVRSGTHAVDLVGIEPEKRLALDSAAKEAGVLVVPGLGVAPGLSNVLVGRAVSDLDATESAVIKVGGLPLNPEPPLHYRIVFCFDSLIEACKRKVRILKDGKLTEVEPLSGRETVEFPEPVGECECFFTDGLSTLLHTFKDSGMDFLAEKTVRYPGWCEKMGFLRDIGLFGDEPVQVGDCRVRPAEFLSRLLDPQLRLREGEKDVTVMRVEVTGLRNEEKVKITYDMVDHYDEEHAVTSMARTTAYPCTSALRMIARGDLDIRGVIPPESLFTKALFGKLLADLRERGVVVHERETKL